MARFKNNFRDVLAAKEVREQRSIGPADMARETDLAYTTAQRWFNDDVTRYDDDVLVAICDWVPCTLDQLLAYIPPRSRQSDAENVTTSAQTVGIS